MYVLKTGWWSTSRCAGHLMVMALLALAEGAGFGFNGGRPPGGWASDACCYQERSGGQAAGGGGAVVYNNVRDDLYKRTSTR